MVRSSATSAIESLARRIALAEASTVYRRAAAAASTRASYSGATFLVLPPRTREAVATETPAAAATSCSVTVGLAA
ncbi:hypothetical protein [Nonomuraea sp. PA05]|uniref:hypothetical protein n=1 Tax=Nonomuraea sp. PA05 TaxID=2604466 RepID=UPI001651CBB6|nr:hypothetical protein [Nonomuraea sp. PA05]